MGRPAGDPPTLVDDSAARYDYARRRPLGQVLDAQGRIGAAACVGVVDQALALMTDAYVHLPLKRALYAVDPEIRLRLLRRRLLDGSLMVPTVDAIAFHAEMHAIFASLRDRHTRYCAPARLGRWDAFLPFDVEAYWEPDQERPRYVVSSLGAEVTDAADVLGAEVTHVNGVPVDVAVGRLSETAGGANDDASWARGMALLTHRSLDVNAPPDEEWVDLTVRTATTAEPTTHRFAWQAGLVPASQRGAADPENPHEANAMGLDDGVHRVGHGRRVRVHESRRTLPALRDHAEHVIGRVVDVGGERYGHLRIFSFNVADEAAFVRAIARGLGELPRAGVIVDIRGNAGGSVVAAERLLQLFADGPIQPAPLQLRSTALTLRLTDHAVYAAWHRSVEQGIGAGAGYSAAYPCRDPRAYNDLGRVYPGPAVLIVDALSYSAAEFFAAGWQDNGVGKVLGTSWCTGGGGATRLSYQGLRQRLGDGASGLAALRGRESFTVAVRRSLRVGENTGMLVEDFGVRADALHRLTREDVLGANALMLERAVGLLGAGGPPGS